MKLSALVTLSVLTAALTGCGQSSISMTNGTQLACLTGTWNQTTADLQNQYDQIIPANIKATVSSGTTAFTFNADNTFVQQISNVKVQSSVAGPGLDPEVAKNLTMEISMNGSINGQYSADATNTIYLDNIDASKLTSSTTMNGEPMMNSQSMGMMPGARTQISATCSGNQLTLNYHVAERVIALHLSR
jgi:hypothetical protein